MKDIKLTDNNRLEIKNGDLVLVDGVDRIKQHLTVAIKGTLPGTWLLDPMVGIDWFSGLAVYTSILKAQVKNAINKPTFRKKPLDTENMPLVKRNIAPKW